MPSPDTALSILLPTGEKLVASPTLKTQAPECSAASNLQMQLAPWIASMTCQLAMLKLIRPLVDVVGGLPTPAPKAIQEFMKAAAGIQPCLVAATPAGILPFLRQLLCFEIQSLGCLRQNLQTIASSRLRGRSHRPR